ncbi:MAG: M20/M25/M40 family metallo-hydrolase [Nitrospiraceae bacterium]|nr:M20/M25/M40 family metallo-hydrolase [Nitrospiraceae bacterium]
MSQAVHDRLKAHLQTIVGDRHPHSAPAKLRQIETHLIAKFRGFGLNTTLHPFKALSGTYRNVVASFPISSKYTQRENDVPLIIAAHYDTVPHCPGADDNGSGLAVMLEVAQSLAEMSSDGNVRFIAFCLEEENLLGSLAYAAHLKQTHQMIRGAIVLECVGFTSLRDGSQQKPPGVPIAVPTTGDFLAVIGNTASSKLVAGFEAVAKKHVPDLKTVPLVVPGNGEKLPDTRRSDHAAFWHYGYPAIMLTDTANFRNPNYHRPTDSIDTLDFAFMSKVAAAVAATTIELAGNPKP